MSTPDRARHTEAQLRRLECSARGSAWLALVVLACCCLPAESVAAEPPSLEIVGSGTTALDELTVRYTSSTFDQCEFSGLHSVSASDGEILVELKPRMRPLLGCVYGRPVARHHIYIGRLPKGSYSVRARVSAPDPGSVVVTVPDDGGEAVLTIDLPEGMADGQSIPQYDYTGAYWSPDDSGWQLNIVHQDNDQLTILWAAYDEDSRPVWYFTLPGEWEAPLGYRAPLARTSAGPSILAPSPSGASVEVEVVGELLLSGVPLIGLDLSYSIDGRASSRAAKRYVQAPP